MVYAGIVSSFRDLFRVRLILQLVTFHTVPMRLVEQDKGTYEVNTCDYF